MEMTLVHLFWPVDATNEQTRNGAEESSRICLWYQELWSLAQHSIKICIKQASYKPDAESEAIKSSLPTKFGWERT
jgi:hypothetical protein